MRRNEYTVTLSGSLFGLSKAEQTPTPTSAYDVCRKGADCRQQSKYRAYVATGNRRTKWRGGATQQERFYTARLCITAPGA